MDGVFAYGKYAGDAVSDVVRSDFEYVHWAVMSREHLALTDEDVAILQRAIVDSIGDTEEDPEVKKIVEEGLANDGQMVSVAGNGGRVVGGGGPAAPMLLLTPPPIPETQPPPIPEPPPIPLIEMPPLMAVPPAPPRPVIVWTPEQRQALDEIDEWYAGEKQFFALTGPAGTGKSTLVREISDRYPGLALTAMTGKAALRLAECAGRGASTLHKVLYYPPKGGQDLKFTRLREPTSRMYAIDESSMMTPAVYEDLQRWDYGVRYLLVGDSYQLPPVITERSELDRYGEDFSAFAYTEGVALKTVMRNAGGVLEAATHVRETGEICTRLIADVSGGYEYVREANPLRRAVDDYLDDPDDHYLITWKNSSRMAANARIRELLGYAGSGPLPDPGERVLIKKNGQGYMNGEIVVCDGFDTGPMIGSVKTLWMKVRGAAQILVSYEGGGPKKRGEFFDGQMPWIESWKKYQIELQRGLYPEPVPVTWAYCLTAHSAQGSQARRVTVFLDRADVKSGYFNKPTKLPTGETAKFSARFIYTAMTRSTKMTTMIVGK
jgi:hypothetical protein